MLQNKDTSPKINAVELAIMANRMDAVVREMTNTMLLAAKSSVLGIARDFSCAIISHDDQVLATAEALPIHVLGMDSQFSYIRKYHPDFKEGDAFLDNDPYAGSSHAADHTTLVPVFYDGVHCFTVGVKAHQADTGNSLPTTYMATATDVYNEGSLIFPGVKIQENYKDNQDIVRMCKKRIRVPDQWFGDYLAAIGSARIGERSCKEIIKKYGVEKIIQFQKEWLDYSERLTADAIKKMPKGKLKTKGWHDPMDPILPDRIYVNLDLDIDPDKAKVTVDLRDNIDCIDAGLNLTEATATMAAAQGVFHCLKEDIPANSGSLRRIEVLLREGCLVGIPKFPHSCSMGTTNFTDVIINTTMSSFAELGEGLGFAHGNYCNTAASGVASGTDPRRGSEPFVNQMFMMGGGGGASATTDGMHYYFVPVGAGLLYRDSVEINEQRFPIMIKSMKLLEDSMGHGRRRGGPATEVIMGPRGSKMKILHACNGLETAPKGVRGGTESKLGENVRIAPDGSEHPYPAVMNIDLEPGDLLRSRDQGGGGYGEASEREIERVLKDVKNKFISKEIALTVYGVVIIGSEKNDSLDVDIKATEKKRSEIRKKN